MHRAAGDASAVGSDAASRRSERRKPELDAQLLRAS